MEGGEREGGARRGEERGEREGGREERGDVSHADLILADVNGCTAKFCALETISHDLLADHRGVLHSNVRQ